MNRPTKLKDRVRVRGNLHTLSFAALVIAMGYAGGVQSNGAAYLLAFLTAALGAISYVHARANLRGLQMNPGQMPVTQAGKDSRFAVEIRAASGQSPCALEVLVVGTKRAVLVERIRSGDSTKIAVELPAQEIGPPQQITLLVRSAYPLGLFSAERRVDIHCLRKVLPSPKGDLPLPEANVKVATETSSYGRTPFGEDREGDDFAGLREWQLGDSPRHIDWRAAARGRPLMVKTWSSGNAQAIRLDWETVTLPPQERAGQMAKWLEICERRGVPYSMVLPETEIGSGLGPAHLRRCLEALSDLVAKSVVAEEAPKMAAARVPQSQERAANLPRRPLMLLSLFLILAAIPLWDVIATSSLLVLLACLVWRIARGSTPERGWMPIAVAAAGIAAMALTQETLLSMEAGMAVLVILLGGKVLEARSPHDFQVLAMAGWFLCLCGLLAQQSLERSLYTFAIFIGITGCMVRFRRATPGMGPPLRLTSVFLMQALPIAVILFVVFPRGSFDYLARRFGSSRTSVTGVPSELDPGDIARVAMSDGVAFRAKFPSGFVPPNQMRYWRCVVLWESWGLNWRRGQPPRNATADRYTPHPQDVRQVIDMEPNGQHWVAALDTPVSRGWTGDRSLFLDFDDTVRSTSPVHSQKRFDIISRSVPQPSRLSRAQREAALQLPPQVPASMRALAEQWGAAAQDDTQIVQYGLLHLRNGGYSYTLDPGTYPGASGLEHFWTLRKQGFCGHYSASFAVMMRMAGVPARVVMGYLGGEWNDRGGYMIVHQSDAHAWVEVWLENRGWTRVDPTAVLVPQRLNLDLESSLLGDEEALLRQRDSLWWQTYQSARLFWDHIGYQWYNYVIDFDEAAQEEWLRGLGLAWLGYLRGPALLVSSGIFLLLALLGLSFWLRRPASHRDPWARAWQRLCKHLVRLGLPERGLSEGPLAYASRAGDKAPPALAAEIRRLADLYAEARYGGHPRSLKAFRRGLNELRQANPKAP